MKPKSRKRSPTIGEFINHGYDVYFPYDLAHNGGIDADHLPVIPGNDFLTETSHGDEFTSQRTASTVPHVVSKLDFRPES